MKLNIPLYMQTTKMNCGPVALKMVLEFLGEEYSIEDMEREVGIIPGEAVYTIKLALAARKLGFKAAFYTRFLGLNPEHKEMDFYKKNAQSEMQTVDSVCAEAKRLGVEIHEKPLTLEEIIENIKEDRVMIAILDWNIIKNQEEKGYQGHFVPIVGYDEENVYVHNHGFHKPTAFLPIRKDLFDKARKAKGTDEDIVIIYKKQAKAL